METPDRSRLIDLRLGMMYSPPTPGTNVLGKRVLDNGIFLDDNGMLKPTPMDHSHTIPGSILTLYRIFFSNPGLELLETVLREKL